MTGTKTLVFTWPGMHCSLPPICGIQKLWITSAEEQRGRHGVVHGHVDLVGGGELAAGVVEGPPPLVAGDLQAHRPRLVDREDAGGVHGEVEEHRHDDRRDDGPDGLHAHVPVCLLRARLGGTPAADDGKREPDPHHDQHAAQDAEHDEGERADVLGLRARGAEDGGRRAAGEQQRHEHQHDDRCDDLPQFHPLHLRSAHRSMSRAAAAPLPTTRRPLAASTVPRAPTSRKPLPRPRRGFGGRRWR